MTQNFTDDNGNPQTFGLQNESTIDLSAFDATDILYLSVTIDGVTEEYECSKDTNGGPHMRPKVAR